MLKKLIAVLFVVSMVAMLSACSGKGNGNVCDRAVDLTSADCQDDPAGDPLDDDSDGE